MLPVSDANRNRATHGALAHAPGRMKSGVEFATVPVGKLPEMVIVCGLPFKTTGVPPTSPRINWLVLVPLFATQNGLELLIEMPHGFTRSGSSTGARPGMSESNVVSR